MKYGFIGSGNMAGALAGGLIGSGKYSAGDFFVYNPYADSRKKFVDKYKITPLDNLQDLFERCGTVFLAVKPNMYPSVLGDIRQYLVNTESKSVVLISMAAGYRITSVEEALAMETPIIRIMPNLNAEIRMGMTALCVNSHVTPAQKEAALELFNNVGLAMELEEKYFGVYSAIAGCSPAFTYLFIDSLAKGAQKMGMNKKEALTIAAQTVMGSAKMLLDSDEHPWELIDKVCSPGGLTIEGICTLEDYRFESGLVHAIENIVEKDKTLADPS